jgi:hypothetical protein
VKIFRTPPCPRTAMPSIESAPATVQLTRDDTFNPALAALSVGTVIQFCARAPSSAFSASFMIGSKPAVDMKFGASNEAKTTLAAWDTQIYEVFLSSALIGVWLEQSSMKGSALKV